MVELKPERQKDALFCSNLIFYLDENGKHWISVFHFFLAKEVCITYSLPWNGEIIYYFKELRIYKESGIPFTFSFIHREAFLIEFTEVDRRKESFLDEWGESKTPYLNTKC